MQELGSRLEHYPTSNHRRAVKAATGALISVPFLVVGTFLVVILHQHASTGMALIGAVLGCGVGLFLMAASLAVQAVRRRGEEFTLYEDGFVHSWGMRTVVVPWRDVVSVVDMSKNNTIARFFGNDVVYFVFIAGGRKVVINSYTDGAKPLISRISEAVDAANGCRDQGA